MKKHRQCVKSVAKKATIFACVIMVVSVGLTVTTGYLNQNQKTLRELRAEQAAMQTQVPSETAALPSEIMAASVIETVKQQAIEPASHPEASHISTAEMPSETSSPSKNVPRDDERFGFFERLSATTCSNIFNGGYVVSDGEKHYLRGTNGFLWRAGLDDTEEACLLNRECWYISLMGDYVYFKNDTDHCLARIRKDGTGYETLYASDVFEINLVEDGIYFSTGEKVCKMNFDGSGLRDIVSGNIWYLNITEDKLFFCRVGASRSLCSCNLDGSGLMTILPEMVYDVMVVGNQIYYTYGKEDRYLYAMDKNTYEPRLVNAEYTRWINTDYRFIYFTNYEGKNANGIGYGNMLMRVSFDGTIHKQALADTIKGIVIQEGKAYYTDLDNRVRSVVIE